MESPFARLKVVQLREQLAARGLSTKGPKKDLLERLEEASIPEPAADIDRDRTIELLDESNKVLTSGPVDIVEPKVRVIEYNTENDDESNNLIGIDNIDYGCQKLGNTVNNDEASVQQIENNNENPIQIGASKDKTHSSIVKISNFVRPFTLESVQSLLSQYGTVTTFWMDKLRTSAFVEYESIEAARLCQFHMDGLQWPLVIGKQLAVEFSSPELMNAAMNAPVLPDPIPFPKNSETKTLDEIFCKTTTRPHIYFLPKHKQ
jgi:hypothetical protein